ncbi:MAG: triose-phosphate isomerase [Rhodocyclaceae bacterium]|nr:triose-phosphate isomerase [Rhodocyclaceae bacterium]
MRRKLIAGNWKMNASKVQCEALISALLQNIPHSGGADMAVCVPYPYLAQVESALRDSTIRLGAQDVSEHDKGAYTGEVSGAMLADFSCKYVIVGHSERRSYYGDSDEVLALKFLAAKRAGLIPILCLGETLEERERGVTRDILKRQLDAVFDRVSIAEFAGAVVAYEPVWAIGTGKTATPEQAQDAHAFIRDQLRLKSATVAAETQILYGGSMKASNARELLVQPDIDGGLIGGASLIADDFIAIATAA